MPFVKVKVLNARDNLNGDSYINTDNIYSLNPSNNTIYFADRYKYGDQSPVGTQVTPESFDYLLTCVEVSAAMSETPIEPLSLKSRIAQALRYEFPGGVGTRALRSHLKEESAPALDAAMIALKTERVAVYSDILKLWFHASNFTKPSPNTEF